MKKLLLIVAFILATFGLVGCGDATVEDIKRIAALREACEEAGGEFWQDTLFYKYHCDLTNDSDRRLPQ